MRRPVCLIAVAFAAGICFEFQFTSGGYVTVFISLALAVLSFAFASLKKSTKFKLLCILLTFFALGSLCIRIQADREDKLVSMVGKHVTLEGTIRSIEKTEDEKYRILLKTDNEKSKILITVYGDTKDMGFPGNYYDMAGRRAAVTGKPEIPSQRRNPNTFDYRQYLKTRGINTVMNVKPHSVEIKEGQCDRLINLVSAIRCEFAGKMAMAAGDGVAGIMSGMLFGDKSAMDEDIYEVFQKNGTAHILAVSGIHMGILYMSINALLKPRRNVRLNLLLIAVLFFYVALASFSPSVVRAALMIALHIVSKLLNMRYDLLCSGAAVAFLMLLLNPMSLFHPGFQLSFLAIFTLAIVLPAAQRIYSGWIMPAAVIQIGMIPITAYSFNYFSWVALFVNVPVIFLSGIIIPLGIILMPLSYLSEALFETGAIAAGVLCDIMLEINGFAYKPGFSFFYVTSPPFVLLCLFYCILFAGSTEAAWIYYSRKGFKGLGISLAVIIAAASVFAVSTQDDFRKAGLVFVDVGQGDCLHIRTPGGKNILIDGGGSSNYDTGRKTLLPYLLKNGVRKVDMILVTHRHLDHYGGVVSLAQCLDIGSLCFYEANKHIEGKILEETGLSADKLIYLTKGQKVLLEPNVWIEILYPESKPDAEYKNLVSEDADENAISLIMKIHYEGITALMTGDIDMEGERNLIEACADGQLNSDIVKVAHHGSKYSSSAEFVEKTRPEIAVAQVGKNNFGHPAEEALSKYEEAGASIFRNDKHGAIAVILKEGKEKMTIRTMILENE